MAPRIRSSRRSPPGPSRPLWDRAPKCIVMKTVITCCCAIWTASASGRTSQLGSDMSIERKFKMALDEVRLLMLGSQILVGFQLRGAFQEGFDGLPNVSKGLDVLATLLIVTALALLVAPSSQHRLVERGEITARIRRVVNGFADVALLPFALALGLDLYVVMAKAFGQPARLVAAAVRSE